VPPFLRRRAAHVSCAHRPAERRQAPVTSVSDVDDLTIASLKAQWIVVLDDLEATHRTAWLAFHDARLAALVDDVLTLDFSDATKMAGVHGYERAAKPQFAVALADSIERVTGRRLRIETTTPV
jgi:hypothetical protein